MSTIRIPLHSRKHPGLFAVIDEEDFDLVSEYRWNVQPGRNTFYAITGIYDRATGKTSQVKMHRLIAATKADKFIDHIDGDGLNNTRGNLREVSNTQNLRNRRDRKTKKSIFTGVHFDAGSAGRPWKSYIGIGGGSPRYLGRYTTEVEAAQAYDLALDQYKITDRVRNLPREYKGKVEDVESVETGAFNK